MNYFMTSVHNRFGAFQWNELRDRRDQTWSSRKVIAAIDAKLRPPYSKKVFEKSGC